MVGMVLVVARWCRALGEDLFRFVSSHRAPVALLVAGLVDEAWFLNDRQWSIHTPKYLMESLDLSSIP